MKATKHNALISQAKVGIAFEYGKDKSKRALNKMVVDIRRLFQYFGVTKGTLKKKRVKTMYFMVNSVVEKPKGAVLLPHIQNYVLVRKGESYARSGKNLIIAKKNFYPILFGQKNYEYLFGFMANRVDPLVK
jgi:succinylglutamate desuccinylase